jgi:hypothetical protein
MLNLKFGKDNSNGPGTGGKYAKAFYALDTKEKAAFIKELQIFVLGEIKTKITLMRTTVHKLLHGKSLMVMCPRWQRKQKAYLYHYTPKLYVWWRITT